MKRADDASALNAGRMGNAQALGSRSTALDAVTHFAAAAGGASTPRTLLAGKSAVVTGGGSGIGVETVVALAWGGARVLVGARDVAAARAALAPRLAAEGVASDGVSVEHLDLASLPSVAAFADAALAWAAPPRTLDFVVCNAGVMALPARELTPHGFECQIGVNHFGHHCLVRALRPRLVGQGTPARVVYVASRAHLRGSIDVADLHFGHGREYTPWGAYGQVRRAREGRWCARNAGRAGVTRARFPYFARARAHHPSPQSKLANVLEAKE